MSLATIKTAAYDILQVSSPSAEDDVSMLAVLNHCRLTASRDHDFVAMEATGYLTVAATTGGSLSDTKVGYTVGVGPSGSALDVKSLRFARTYDSTNGVWVPAQLMRMETYEALVVRADRVSETGYPSAVSVPTSTWEEPFKAFDTRNLILIDGSTLYSLRDSSVDVKLYTYKWLTAYASFSATADFLITYGEDYMMWFAICAMNYKKGVFLPRNEGNIDPSSPQAMRDAAWASLLTWDTYQKQQTNYIQAPSS